MAFTPPPASPTTMTTAPTRAVDNATFNTLADNWMAWLSGFTTFLQNFITWATTWQSELTIAQADVTTKQGIASAAATNAAVSATSASATAGAAAWVNGNTYVLNQNAISQLNFQTYRKKTASSVSVIDPQNDATNWVLVNFYSFWSTVTGSYSAAISDNLQVNTTSAAANITLPNTGLVAGVSRINFKDYAGTFQANNLTVIRNGNPIEGVAQDMTVINRGISFGLLYIDATKGWSII